MLTGGLESTRALWRDGLKVEPNLSRQRARRHIVRPAEGRKEVVQRRFVGHVDGGECKTPFVTIAFEQVVVARGYIKQVTGRDTRWIMVVVLRVRRWDLDQIGSKLRCQAKDRKSHSRRGTLRSAKEPRFELLVCG